MAARLSTRSPEAAGTHAQKPEPATRPASAPQSPLQGVGSSVDHLWSLVSGEPGQKGAAPEDAPPTVNDFIALVRKVEQSHPDWTAEDVTNALRRLGGYDSGSWQKMLGTDPAAKLEATGDLTKEDIEALQGMLAHHQNGTTEGGLVTDRQGESIAMGHVITGLSAGQHRDKDRNLAGKLGWLGIGENLDNLYATTIAGDLGQSAHMLHQGKQTNLVGQGTEATDAELNGDIDGFLMGSHLQELTRDQGLTGKVSLSDMLSYYYVDNECKLDGPSGPISSQRYDNFASEVSRKDLKDQTQRFAANYGYTTHVDDDGAIGGWLERQLGKDPDGLFRSANKESNQAVDAFGSWLNGRRGKQDGQQGAW